MWRSQQQRGRGPAEHPLHGGLAVPTPQMGAAWGLVPPDLLLPPKHWQGSAERFDLKSERFAATAAVLSALSQGLAITGEPRQELVQPW